MASLLTTRSQRRVPPRVVRSARTLGHHGAASVSFLSTWAGVAAAAGPLIFLMALGVVGWFVTDASMSLGAGGHPVSGIRIGGLAWLMGHGSGVTVANTRITLIPLGLTLLACGSAWRRGTKLGTRVAGSGRDALVMGGALFALGYVLVTIATVAVSSVGLTQPSMGRAVLGSLLVVVVGGWSGILRGSGAGARFGETLPATLRDGLRLVPTLLTTFLVVTGLVFIASWLADYATALNIGSQLKLGFGPMVLLVIAMLAVVPNAVLFTAAFVLGPGFVLGTGTSVALSGVTLGPMPMFPILAALPKEGTPAGWTGLLLLLAPVAVFVVVLVKRSSLPAVVVGALLAALALGVLMALSGGAIGPHRMSHVAAHAGASMMKAAVDFVLGGGLGALVVMAWRRWGAPRW